MVRSIPAGPKLALLIGINYRGTRNELQGCIHDVERMREYLVRYRDYEPRHITMITDDTPVKPTAFEILHALGVLILDAHRLGAEEVFLHYSGHGTHEYDTSGDEKDHQDEAIVPLDYESKGTILDDVLYAYVARLPRHVRMIALFDCCHSGTIMDLRYLYQDQMVCKVENTGTNIGGSSTVKADVKMISGCRDDQTSADALIDRAFSGAMTAAFLSTLKTLGHPTHVSCHELVQGMRMYLREHDYDQVPQLTSSQPLHPSSNFL